MRTKSHGLVVAIDQVCPRLLIDSKTLMQQPVRQDYLQMLVDALCSTPNHLTQMHSPTEPNDQRRNHRHYLRPFGHRERPMNRRQPCTSPHDSLLPEQLTTQREHPGAHRNHCHPHRPNAATPPGDSHPEAMAGRRLKALQADRVSIPNSPQSLSAPPNS
jgi:hypothetical protein